MNVMAFGARLPWLESCLCKKESICFLILKLGIDYMCSQGDTQHSSRHMRGATLAAGDRLLPAFSALHLCRWAAEPRPFDLGPVVLAVEGRPVHCRVVSASLPPTDPISRFPVKL